MQQKKVLSKEEWMLQLGQANRIIGLVPRVKAKADSAPSPTTLAIFDVAGAGFRPKFELLSEQEELDFVLGCMPVTWRKLEHGHDPEILKTVKAHHVRTKKDPADKKKRIPSEIPETYEGLKKNDVVVMGLGGPGDYLAFALSRKAEEIGALVLRCPPVHLKAFRDGLTSSQAEKAEPTGVIKTNADDSLVLAQMVKIHPEVFYPVLVREQELTWMRECYRARMDVMKARIACSQRLRQRFIGRTFCCAGGGFPEGAIEDAFKAEATNDEVLSNLIIEEASADRELLKACERLPVYNEVFGQIEGAGPAISSRLIAAIQDVRRFSSKWKLRKYCGVFCTPDGRMARRRKGETAGWSPECRQALFLLADQFNRRPESPWGKRLKANKEYYRLKHPVELEIDQRCVQHFRAAFNIFRRLQVDMTAYDTTIKLDIDTVFGYVKAGHSLMVEQVDAGIVDETEVKKIDLIIASLEKLISVGGKKGNTDVFTPGHIHKMAIWKTLGEFVEWLFEAWWMLDEGYVPVSAPSKAPKTDDVTSVLVSALDESEPVVTTDGPTQPTSDGTQ